jgi:hypothetical protein
MSKSVERLIDYFQFYALLKKVMVIFSFTPCSKKIFTYVSVYGDSIIAGLAAKFSP